MALTPHEAQNLPALTEEDLEFINDLEKKIDDNLRKRSSPQNPETGTTYYFSEEEAEKLRTQPLTTELVNRYELAGWSIKLILAEEDKPMIRLCSGTSKRIEIKYK